MSKAFNKVNRAKLFKDLTAILEIDELHLLKILINKVKLSVRCGKTIGETFETNQGVPQGDCLSPIMFIFYLARTLGHNAHLIDHTYAKPQHLSSPEPKILKEHDYYINKEKFHEVSKQMLTIDTEYADDVGKNVIHQSQNTENNTNKKMINFYKQHLPTLLQNRNLQCNPDKTVEFTIARNGDTAWKNCKYLGSLLDTNNDIKRRKQLAMSAAIKLSDLWQSNKATVATKLRIFDACVKSIFLYNAELWGMSSKTENMINSFHRKLL